MSALKHWSFHIAILFVQTFFIFSEVIRDTSVLIRCADVLFGSGLGRSAGRQRGEVPDDE